MQQNRRRGVILGLMAIGLMAATALTADPAQAASSNGPYYATPSWDQKLAAATRFVVLLDWGSEAVLDRETGLVWEQAPATVVQTWANARGACLNSSKGGRKGWRLPSIVELLSLVDPSVASPGPALPPGHPFTDVQSTGYWSASTDARNPPFAWLWDFHFGLGIIDKTSSVRVWCVRGPMNAEAY